jgi:hypothetical protein
MSKHPPIGAQFLENLCNSWEERLITPPDLNIKVPGYNGYWYVKGDIRQYLCERLHDINKKRIEQTGTQSPTWRALLASVVDCEKDWETLVYGPEIEQNFSEETEIAYRELEDAWWSEHLRQRRWLSSSSARRELLEDHAPNECGELFPCRACFGSLTREKQREAIDYIHAEVEKLGGDHLDAVRSYRTKSQTNPYCQRLTNAEIHALDAEAPSPCG